MSMKRKITIPMVAIMVFLLPTASTVRGYHEKQKSKKKHSIQQIFATVPFNRSATELQREYLGHDLRMIYNILENRMPDKIKKDEFETSEQYKERLNDEFRKPILDSLAVKSTYAFKAHRCDIEYDADSQMLTLSCYLGPVFEDRQVSASRKSITWRFENKFLDSYVGTNAFGAARTIDRWESQSYDIALENLSQFQIDRRVDMNESPLLRSSYPNFFLTSKVAMPPGEARRIKPATEALVVCELAEPYVTKDQSYDLPTFDSPSSTSSVEYYLHVNLIELIFFDSSTGQILARVR